MCDVIQNGQNYYYKKIVQLSYIHIYFSNFKLKEKTEREREREAVRINGGKRGGNQEGISKIGTHNSIGKSGESAFVVEICLEPPPHSQCIYLLESFSIDLDQIVL